MVSAGGREK
ncbi:hypothetical protein D030_4194A, partial [Vibrio parahaemolyticus AQ3810]